MQGGDADGRFLNELDATPRPKAGCAPFDTHADAYVLPGDGDVVMISRALGRPRARSIVGGTVLVKHLAKARALLDANRVSYVTAAGCTDRSIWIRPEDANNLWLDLRE